MMSLSRRLPVVFVMFYLWTPHMSRQTGGRFVDGSRLDKFDERRTLSGSFLS